MYEQYTSGNDSDRGSVAVSNHSGSSKKASSTRRRDRLRTALEKSADTAAARGRIVYGGATTEGIEGLKPPYAGPRFMSSPPRRSGAGRVVSPLNFATDYVPTAPPPPVFNIANPPSERKRAIPASDATTSIKIEDGLFSIQHPQMRPIVIDDSVQPTETSAKFRGSAFSNPNTTKSSAFLAPKARHPIIDVARPIVDITRLAAKSSFSVHNSGNLGEIPPPPFVSPVVNETATHSEAHAAAVFDMYRQYYASLSTVQQAEIHRRFDSKFVLLANRFKEWRIAIPADGSTLEYKHTIYEGYVKQINIHMNLIYYKFFLVGIFVAMELGFSKAGIAIPGYAERQIRKISRYDEALIELGEKYSGGSGGEWSVETRLGAIIVSQAVVAIAAVYLKKIIPMENLEETLNGLMDMVIPTTQPQSTGSAANVVVDDGLDSQGLPIVPGMEADIAAIDGGRALPARAAPAPALDLGSMLGGLGAMFGGGGGNAGDMAKLVGTAMNFLTPKLSPTPTTAPTSPAKPRTTSPPRRAPVFSS